MARVYDVTTSVLSTLIRFAGGVSVGALGKHTEKPLELYEFENCPF